MQFQRVSMRLRLSFRSLSGVHGRRCACPRIGRTASADTKAAVPRRHVLVVWSEPERHEPGKESRSGLQDGRRWKRVPTTFRCEPGHYQQTAVEGISTAHYAHILWSAVFVVIVVTDVALEVCSRMESARPVRQASMLSFLL